MNTQTFPFHFGTVVSGDFFYDRAAESRALHDEIVGGQNVVLYAPRRYGKTSLAMRVAEEWKRDGFICIYFDLMRVDSLDDFLREYADAALAAEGRTERGFRAVLSALASLRPKLSLGEDGKPVLELDFGPRGVSAKSLAEVLALPERLSSEDRHIVVLFDEFQEIAVLSRHVPAERIFRSVIQHQKRTRYVFLGSKTHLLRRMFDDRAKPFYRSATPIVLGKPPMEESRAFLTDRFRSVRMKLPDAVADAILSTSDNIPYYLQAVALRTWMAASRRGVPAPGKEDVETALDDLVGLHRATYEATASALSETQRRLLSAIARDPVARFDADWRARHFLPGTTTLGSAATKLLNAGLIERGDSCWLIADPIHARYLRETGVRIL